MVKKVLPSQASYEELMKALEEQPKGEVDPEIKAITEELTEYDNNVVPFMSHFKIVPGEHRVNAKVLYRLYKAYVEEPVNLHVFNRILGTFLEKVRIQFHLPEKDKYYFINIDQFGIAKHLFDVKQSSRIDKTRSATYRKYFEAFLTAKNIKNGLKWIEGFMLYEMYLEHCDEIKKKARIGSVVFHNFLKLYFKYKRVGSNRSLWFNINEEAVNYYTEEQKNDIREKRRRKEESNGKKQPGKRQTSKPKAGEEPNLP